MVLRPLRTLATPEPAAYVNDAWLKEIEASLADPKCDRYRLCREHLRRIYYPGVEDVDALIEDPSTPAATRAALLALDASHVTLEPEYYGEIDPDRYVAVKPLLWFMAEFRPLSAGWRQRRARRPASADPGPLHLSPLRHELQMFSVRRVLVRILDGGRRRRGDPPARVAR